MHFLFILYLVNSVIFSILLIKNIIDCITFEKKVNRFGNKLSHISSLNKPIIKSWRLLSLICGILVSIVAISLIIFTHSFIYLGTVIFIISIESYMWLMIKISKHNGLYENGIIYNTFARWESFSSWRIIKDNILELKSKNGITSTFEIKQNFEDVIDLLKMNIKIY